MNGLIFTDRHDWNVLWTHTQGKTYFYERLNPYQKINHFPNSTEITRKDRLAINLKKMQEKFSRSYYNFFPETFVLPDQYSEFEQYFELIEKRIKVYNNGGIQITSSIEGLLNNTIKPINLNLWIIKPQSSSQGRGIYIIDNLKQVPKHESLVISRYIDNPLLLYGHKFDLRIYVVITSYDPLKIYVYREGLVRFATEKYDLSKFNDTTKFSHLTNYSINKKNENYVQNENAEEDDSGFKWSLSALNQYFEEQGIDINLMWSKIYDLIIKSLLSIEDQIKIQIKKSGINRNNCYELFGYDIILDNNINPWLLEVNLSPSLAFDSPLDLKIKGNLLKDTFNLIGVYNSAKETNIKGQNIAKSEDSRKKFQQLNTMAKTVFKENNDQDLIYNELMRQIRKLNDFSWNQKEYIQQFISLNQKQKEIVIETMLELKRRGNFIRIYPNKSNQFIHLNFFVDSDFYDCFMSQNKSLQQQIYQSLYSDAFVSFKDLSKLNNIFTIKKENLKSLNNVLINNGSATKLVNSVQVQKNDQKPEIEEIQPKDLYLCIYEYLKRYQILISNSSKNDTQKFNQMISAILFDEKVWKKIDQSSLQVESQEQIKQLVKLKIEQLEKQIINENINKRQNGKEITLQSKTINKNRLKIAGNNISNGHQSVDKIFLKYKNLKNHQLTEFLQKKLTNFWKDEEKNTPQKKSEDIVQINQDDKPNLSQKDLFYVQTEHGSTNLLDYIMLANLQNEEKTVFSKKNFLNATINKVLSKKSEQNSIDGSISTNLQINTSDKKEQQKKQFNNELLNKVNKFNQKLNKLGTSQVIIPQNNSENNSMIFENKRNSMNNVQKLDVFKKEKETLEMTKQQDRMTLKMLEDIIEEQKGNRQKTQSAFQRQRNQNEQVIKSQFDKEIYQSSPLNKLQKENPFQMLNNTITNHNRFSTNLMSFSQERYSNQQDFQKHSSQSRRDNQQKQTSNSNINDKSTKIYEIYGKQQQSTKSKFQQSKFLMNGFNTNQNSSHPYGMIKIHKKVNSDRSNNSFQKESQNFNVDTNFNLMFLPGIHK